MPETFLILLAGGIMLAAAVPQPREVSVHWLRLAGILALAFAGLAIFFLVRRAEIRAMVLWTFVGAGAAMLAQLAFVQVLALGTQRLLAMLAFFIAVGGALVLTAGATIAKPQAAALLLILACAGVGATCGIALMDMLLGHAYLTAARMTIAPFRRLNFALAVALGTRVVLNLVAVMLQSVRPIELFWPRFGLYVGTRWLVGLIVSMIFVYLAHDCIKRRSTQSATGILYVAGVLIFIGELLALYLVRETGLPW
jgi:hypothetical protein